MNLKTVFTLTLLSGSLLISCKDTSKNPDEDITDLRKTEQRAPEDRVHLIGSWKDQSEKALHFTLNADGTARSDNMATLLYQKWSVKDDQLYLISESVGNGTSSLDTTVYEIQKLNKNQLILDRGDLILEYKKSARTKGALQDGGD